MIEFKCPPLHPSDEELAYFIDGRIIGTRKEEIEEHLVYCDECINLLVEVKKHQNILVKNKKSTFYTPTCVNHTKKERYITIELSIKYINNSWFFNENIRVMILSGVVASSLVIFLITKSILGQFSIGKIDLSKPIIQTMSSSSKYINKIVDGDKIIQEIEKELDKTALSNFIEAQKLESKEEYNEAIVLYKKSFKDAIKTVKGKEKLKWQIVIYYHIARIKFEREDKDSDVYKKRIQFWIQQYVLGE